MSTNDLKQRVEFDFIRYANCWEDADLLAAALAVQPGENVLSIASAGDNSFALLLNNPERVIAVDVNPVQLHLGELKKAAFTLPDYNAFLEFLGFRESTNRLAVYQQLRVQLPDESRAWWDAHSELIAAGVVRQGKFERYFEFFRNRLLPLIHSKKRITELFRTKSASAQREFYNKHWNTWRWRLFFRVFFSRFVMGKYGRDPEFMNEVQVSVGRYIFGKAEQHLQQEQMQRNLYLHHILTGRFEPQLPLYAREASFEHIRNHTQRIVFFKGYAEEACKQYGPFDAFNLSNIFEYLPADVCRTIAEQLTTAACPGARFAYWNLMVPRSLSALAPQHLRRDNDLSDAFTAADQGFFYHRFQLDRLH